jgi:hypothetical protein
MFRRWPGIDEFKKWLEIIQAIATIAGIIVGAIWTYRLFFVQREGFAHATFEERVTRVPLSDTVNLVQVILKLENTGHSLINVTNATVRIEQVLPIRGCDSAQCAAKELNLALRSATRVENRFDWQLVASRDDVTHQPIEPGEKAIMDFEFAVPVSLEVARIYGFIQNDELSDKRGNSVGWNDALIYDFRSAKPTEVVK